MSVEERGTKAASTVTSEVRTLEEEKKFLVAESDVKWRIEKGFVPNMRVPGHFYANKEL